MVKMALQEKVSLFQEPFISTEPETIGFDLSSGAKWIYPENYPKREYQFSIVQTALYNNTLVCLPTGLGKTFIAAVVMYNFWRWYPRGRIVFLAPTKPLVAQQIEACHEIMGIPSEETIELTGAINQIKRRQAWMQKRVIFATPQTFQKDLQNDCVPCEFIKCVVIDEAHKALGKHSYCEIVKMIHEKSKFFRILALSATPGSKIDHVREVIQKLLISELELRDDSSPDITPYTNNRKMEKIIVNLSKELNDYKDKYICIMDPHVRVLIKNQIVQGNTANISKGKIFMLMKQYDSRPQKPNNHGIIMKTLNILLTMYHAYELLIKHGLRAFYNFYSNHSDKFWLEAELNLLALLEDIKQYIGDFPIIQQLSDGTIPDVPNNLTFGHNKFEKLRELLVDHFQNFSDHNKSTRAIVFVEYRDIVNEVYVLLLQTRPLIRPQMFVGQAGQKQKQQLAALEDFRSNKVNVLISTSVGEEGLDVGEVDLIVCFDISTSTPTRLVQRMGRTGRKRSGRVVLLLTDGKEVQTLEQAMSKKDSLNNKVLQSSNICSSLYQSSPRMVPSNIIPQCLSMFIKPLPKTPKIKGKKTKLLEKKPRKKKNIIPINDEPQAFTSKLVIQEKSHGTMQPTMMKFFTSQSEQKKQYSNCDYDSDSGIHCEEFQTDKRVNTSDNPYVTIKSNEVKLLTSDSHALEFLTLCAMKKSEKENFDSNNIKIDKTWIPIHFPNEELRDFILPCLDSLDCIKNLTISNGVIEDNNAFISDDSMSANPDENVNNFTNQLLIMESKYIDESKNINDEVIVSGTFNNCFTNELAWIKRLAKINVSTEENQPSAYNFSHDFYTIDTKNQSQKKIKNINIENKEVDRFPDFDITFYEKSEKACQLSQEIIAMTPAQIEVDFENILDECTESEASESPALIGDCKNIFEELLEEDSADDDLFNFSEDDNNVTILHNKDNNKTLIDSIRLSVKRSVSRSPSADSAAKRHKMSEVDTSDDETILVLGTPPKRANNKSLKICSDVVMKEEQKISYPDSDQDIFDDLDFETQCSFTNIKEILPLQNDKILIDHKMLENAQQPFCTEIHKELLYDLDKTSIDKKSNTVLFQEKADSVLFHSGNKKDYLSKNEIENINNNMEANINIDEKLITQNNKELLKNNKLENIEQKLLFDASKNILDSSYKMINNANIVDCNFEDWNDDDFESIVLKKNKLENEEFSEFFLSNSKKNTGKSRSQETSSGWISVTSTKRTSRVPRNVLTLKNIKPSTSSSKTENITVKSASLDSKKLDISVRHDNDFTVLNAQITTHPTSNLLNLKNNFSETKSRDKDGFAFPQKTFQVNSVVERNEFVKLSKSYNRDKENKLPRWKEKLTKDNSISPRFRKYHSEQNLSIEKRIKKKPKSRKRIANDFIQDEAEISSDVDTSEGSSGEDGDLDNFVSYTQDVHDEVDMKAHYLQAVRSPVRHGAFMIKQVTRHVPDYEIYSQPVTQINDTYLQDSFCIGDEGLSNDNASDSYSNDSTLERLESRLEKRTKKLRKNKESKFNCLKNNNKGNRCKKILTSNSSNNSNSSNDSSSEDDIEKLRQNILEESMLLKN